MGSVKASKFDILRKPILTERSAMFNAQSGGVVFQVHPDANKAEIKGAVESIFDVKVSAVRTSNFLGKFKRMNKGSGTKPAWKKAYVTLQEGHSIDVVEGL